MILHINGVEIRADIEYEPDEPATGFCGAFDVVGVELAAGRTGSVEVGVPYLELITEGENVVDYFWRRKGQW